MKVIEEQWIPPMIIYEKEQKWWSLLKIIYEWEREALGTEDELEELEDDDVVGNGNDDDVVGDGNNGGERPVKQLKPGTRRTRK